MIQIGALEQPVGPASCAHARSEDIACEAEEKTPGSYNAPMPGEVVKVLVKPGAKVKSGDGLVVLSSMKMENTIEAFEDGKVEEVFVKAKDFVEADTPLVKISNGNGEA